MEGFQIFLLVLLCIFVGFIIGIYVYDRIIMKKKLDKAIELTIMAMMPLIKQSIEIIENSDEFKKIEELPEEEGMKKFKEFMNEKRFSKNRETKKTDPKD